MTSSKGNNSMNNIEINENQINRKINKLSVKDSNTAKPLTPKEDIFDAIMKELQNKKEPKINKENNPNNISLYNNYDSNIYNFEISESKKNNKSKEDSQYERMNQLREGLQIQPHFDFGIPLNENASLSIIQKFKEKKEINDNFQRALSKINIIKWLKIYSILWNKQIQNVNYCLNQLRMIYSFDYSKSSIICEVKNIFIIDCYQLLDVIDANFSTKKLILTKNVKKNSKDKGKIKIFYENFVNVGDLLLFKKPQSKTNIIYGEGYLELDIKDIQKIVPFDDMKNSNKQQQQNWHQHI